MKEKIKNWIHKKMDPNRSRFLPILVISMFALTVIIIGIVEVKLVYEFDMGIWELITK